MASTVSLAQMVDLALGTPEVGAVNFNVLHVLLHAMLEKLNLTNVTTQISHEDRELLKNNELYNNLLVTDTKSVDSGLAGSSSSIVDNENNKTPPASRGGGGAPRGGRTPYHVLQQKVAKLEDEMAKLNDLPTNTDLMNRTKPAGSEERPRPVADMWQNMQLKNRVDANEEGIGKLMSLVEDLMSEMGKLKDDSKSIRDDLNNHNIPGLRSDLNDLRNLVDGLDIQSLRDLLDQLKKDMEKLTNRMDNMSDLDELRKKLKDLESLANALNDKLSKYPDASAFIDFVTWKALEEALKGLRDDLEPKDRIVIEMQTQTSRPASAKEPSRPPSSTGPSEELTKMLEDLGILTKRHDQVEVRVDKLEEEMPNKADKSDLAGLSTGGPVDVPEDLLQQLKDLQDQLKALSKARDKLTELEEKLSQLPDLVGMEENIDGLNIGHDDLQNMLDALRNEYEGNMSSLEDKLNSLQELALNPILPEPKTPRTPSPRVKLPPIAGAEPNDKLNDFENALSKKDTEMKALQQKIKFLMTDTNKQVGDVKDKLKNLEKELLNFGRQTKKTPSPIRKTSDAGRKRPSLIRANTSTSDVPPPVPSTANVEPSHTPSTLHATIKPGNNDIPPPLQDSQPTMHDTLGNNDSQSPRQDSQPTILNAPSIPKLDIDPNLTASQSHSLHTNDSNDKDSKSQKMVFGPASSSQGHSLLSEDSGYIGKRVFDSGSHDQKQNITDVEDPFTNCEDGGYHHDDRPNVVLSRSCPEILDTDQGKLGSSSADDLNGVELAISSGENGQKEAGQQAGPAGSAKFYRNATSKTRLLSRPEMSQDDRKVVDPKTNLTEDSLHSQRDPNRTLPSINLSPSACATGGLHGFGSPASQSISPNLGSDQSDRSVDSLASGPIPSPEKSSPKAFPSMPRAGIVLKPLQAKKSVTFISPPPPSSTTTIELSGPNTDSEALSRLQQIVLQLQAELDRLGKTAQKLSDENVSQGKQIDGLMTTSDKLERLKADKEYVQSEVDVKADKRLVEGKVNRSLFDQTTDELNKMIKELLDKLGGKEDEWKTALGSMGEDVDGKLDRLEFGPIRDELERRLKALARQLKELLNRDGGDMEDDAAGIRRQLIQRYNCISCDRPVDMMPQGPIPSIPAPQGLPATRSTRPYTTFELEQIRQHARSLQQPGVEVVDLYATQRACGGTHTMTQPHRRITRVAQYNGLFRDDEIAAPREELDIQGADGHIYRGRLDARLPKTLQQSAPAGLPGPHQASQSPKMSRKIIYAQGGARPPATAPAQAPMTSSRVSPPRPSSAKAIKPLPVGTKQATIPTAGVVDGSNDQH